MVFPHLIGNAPKLIGSHITDPQVRFLARGDLFRQRDGIVVLRADLLAAPVEGFSCRGELYAPLAADKQFKAQLLLKLLDLLADGGLRNAKLLRGLGKVQVSCRGDKNR